MSLVFVTGAPTSGKTALAEVLVERGYLAHDTDDPGHTGISGWHSLETGEFVAGFNELEVTEELMSTHEWRLADGVLDTLQAQAQTETVYLCGSLRDEEPLINASQYVIWLVTDEKTIRERFQLPREVTWGKEEWQVARTIVRNREKEEQFRLLGAIMIDSRQPLDKVADQVIQETVA